MITGISVDTEEGVNIGCIVRQGFKTGKKELLIKNLYEREEVRIV